MRTAAVLKHTLDLGHVDSRLDSANPTHLLERERREFPTVSLGFCNRTLLGSNR